jgi:hypothetical protein
MTRETPRASSRATSSVACQLRTSAFAAGPAPSLATALAMKAPVGSGSSTPGRAILAPDLPPVVHGFDVVSVWVEHERAVVAL